MKQGTLALMILKTLDVLGPLHGYGVARRIEETSRNRLTLNYGTLYPALLKLEQEGFIKAEWRQSENNRRAKFYALTASRPQGAGARDARVASHRRPDCCLSRTAPGGSMRYLRMILARISGFFAGRRADAELHDELQAHLEMETAENIRRGMHAGRGAAPGDAGVGWAGRRRRGGAGSARTSVGGNTSPPILATPAAPSAAVPPSPRSW